MVWMKFLMFRLSRYQFGKLERNLSCYFLLGEIQLEDAFWEVSAISKEDHATLSVKNQEDIKEVDLEDGSVELCVDFPPVISIAEEGGKVHVKLCFLSLEKGALHMA